MAILALSFDRPRRCNASSPDFYCPEVRKNLNGGSRRCLLSTASVGDYITRGAVMMRMLSLMMLAGVLAAGGTVLASTSNYTCSVSTCGYEHKIGGSATRQFVGQCWSEETGTVQPDRQHCSAHDENVTCTITVCKDDFCSCSCTNWSATGRHTGKVGIYC